jgi:hypothetical protein
MGEEWIAAAGPALAPSQEEYYLRMREIPRAEAFELMSSY